MRGDRLGPEQAAQLEAGDARHPEVGDDRVGLLVAGELGRLGRRRDLDDVVPLLAEAHTEERACARAIVDQEDSRHGYIDYGRAESLTKQRS